MLIICQYCGSENLTVRSLSGRGIPKFYICDECGMWSASEIPEESSEKEEVLINEE